MARNGSMYEPNALDTRIKDAVAYATYHGYTRADIRIYCDDDFKDNIREELEKRGFTVLYVPEITLEGDVDFYW